MKKYTKIHKKQCLFKEAERLHFTFYDIFILWVQMNPWNTWGISEGHFWMILVAYKFNLGFYYAFCDSFRQKYWITLLTDLYINSTHKVS